MASSFKVGQCIEGKVSTYTLSKQLHKDIWTAMYQAPANDRSPSPLTLNRSSKLGKVIIKSAPKYRLDNERDVLKHFHARPGIRQLLDEIQDPPSLVLKHLDDNLLSASNSKRLENPEIKFIAKRILEALQAFHEDGYVHTGIALVSPFASLFCILDIPNTNQIPDVKPDNILINNSSGPRRFREVELGDCGDAGLVNPKHHLKLGDSGHMIGAHMFRSPEAMLNLRWGTATDIWSFGTTVSDLDLRHCSV